MVTGIRKTHHKNSPIRTSTAGTLRILIQKRRTDPTRSARNHLEVLLGDLLGLLLAELPLEVPLLHLPQPQGLGLGPVLNLKVVFLYNLYFSC